VEAPDSHLLLMNWQNGDCIATLRADLQSHDFTIEQIDPGDGLGFSRKFNQYG
jgi:hypothetical protein